MVEIRSTPYTRSADVLIPCLHDHSSPTCEANRLIGSLDQAQQTDQLNQCRVHAGGAELSNLSFIPIYESKLRAKLARAEDSNSIPYAHQGSNNHRTLLTQKCARGMEESFAQTSIDQTNYFDHYPGRYPG